MANDCSIQTKRLKIEKVEKNEKDEMAADSS